MSYIKNELYKKSLGLKITVFLLVVSILFWMIPSNMIFGEGDDIESLQQAVAEAQEALDAAKTEAENEAIALADAQAAADAATVALEDAQNAADVANAALTDIKVTNEEAKASLAAAEQAVADARAALDAAGGEDNTALEQALSNANAVLDTAKNAADKAAAKLIDAQNAADKAAAALDEAKAAADKTNTALEDAKVKDKEAKAALEDAEKALADAQAALAVLKKAIPSEEITPPEEITALGRTLPITNPTISTDKADYSPGEKVVMTGTGFLPNAVYTIVVTRPDGSVVIGNGSFTPGSDSVLSDASGNFTYNYKLDGILGTYQVEAKDRAGSVVATTTFTDALYKPKTSLKISKTATGSSEGYITWSIEKSVNPDDFNLAVGETSTAHYTVVVTPTYHETGAAVSGNIHIQNDTGKHGEDKTAYITYVKDKIEYKIGSGHWTELKTENISGSFTILTGGSVDVPYSVSFTPVAGATAYRNTALVRLENHPLGPHEFSSKVSFSISGGIITKDAFADVSDSLQGYLGEAWVGDSGTQTFSYDRQVGPYTSAGDYTVNNTATVTGKDTSLTDADSESINIHVAGMGTVTVIKDVRDPNGNPTNDGHHFWVKLYVKTGAYSWSQVGSGWTEFWEGHPAVFSGLEQGKEYKVEEETDSNYQYWYNDGPKTLRGDNVDITVFNKQKTGSVTIRKEVQSSTGGSVNDDHHFWVKLYVQNDAGGWDLVPGTNPKEFWEGWGGYYGHPAQDAVFTNLIKGRTYKAEEVADPNYTLSSITPATIVLSCEPEIVIVNRQCPNGSITVTKSGLEGSDQARLYLWNTNGTPGTGDDTLINTATAPSPQAVSNGGSAVWKDLAYGNYYIVEDFNGITTNVYTYLVGNPVATTTVDGNESLTIKNTAKKGSITVEKIGLEGSDTAIFSISGPAGYTVSPSSVTLDNNDLDNTYPGSYKWSNLPYGQYTITETWGDGNRYTYSTTLSPNPKEVTVDGNEYIKVNNCAEKYSVTVRKSGLEWGSKFTWPFYWADKAEFTLTGPAGPYSDARTATLDNIPFTGYPSFVVWAGLPAGEYILTESYHGTNHFNYTSSITLPLTFNLGPSQAFDIVNYPEKGSLTVKKIGLEGSDRANLSLYDSNGNPVALSPQTVSNGDTAVWSNLPYGDYYIEEDFNGITNTYTYDFTNPIWSGKIEGNVGAETPEVLENRAEKGSIEIFKTDKTTDLPLGGATFELYRSDSSSWALIDSQVLGADGHYKWENLLYGLYKVVEEKAPQGYLLFGDPSTGEIEVILDSETSNVILKEKIADPRIPGKITLNKSGLGSTSVAGFTLYNSDGNAIDGEKRITGNGTVSWNNLEWDTYKIVETTVPSGYNKMANITGIVIDVRIGDHQSYTFDRTNTKIIHGSITLNKNGLGSTSVAGFTLYDSDGNAVGGEKRITGNGTVSWNNLSFDIYKIVETTIPSGYSRMSDITGIVVSSSNLKHSFNRTNKKTTPTTPPGGKIEVLGITELPFTGMNPAIPITGVSSVLAGGLMIILSFARRKFRRK